MLTFGLARSLHRRSTGSSPLSNTVALFGLGLKGSTVSLSTNSFLHLTDSGSRLIVWNSRTPCSSPHWCSSVFSDLPNQDQFQPVHFLPATQQSRSKHTRPDDLPKTRHSALVTALPKRLKSGPSVGSHVIPAKDPTAMSYHPANEGVIRLQSASPLSSQSRASVCAIPLPVLGLLSPWRQWSGDSLSTRVLCWCLACTHRRMRLRVTS